MKDLKSFHPVRKLFQLMLLDHRNNRWVVNRKVQYPRLKKGALKFCRKTINDLLVEPIKSLAIDQVENKGRPTTLHVKYKYIDTCAFEIMYNLKIREFVEILALLKHSVKEITELVNRIPFVHPIPEIAVEHYVYFFWNVLPEDGWDETKQHQLIQYMENSKRLSKAFARHIRFVEGNFTRLEAVLDLGVECPVEIILEQTYKGFCQVVMRKNTATRQNDVVTADGWSKIMVRDTQVLRMMGFKPKHKRLSDRVAVTQEETI